MARQHGSDCRVYFGGRDASGDLAEIEVKASADVHEATNFSSGGWHESDGGLVGWKAPLKGFYDPAVGGYGRQMETLLGASCLALTVVEGDANAIGDGAILLGPGVVSTRGQPIKVADLIKLDGDIAGHGRAGFVGRLLHVLGAETITGATTSLDNAASSANGGRGNLHVTAITGTWTIVIEHSADNGGADPWAALVTFTQVAQAGGVTAESKEVSGTVKRYLRVTFTGDVAGTITFAAGFARY